MTFAQYQSTAGVNISTLLELDTSPLAYRHRLQSPREDCAVFRVGRAVHTAILEPLQFLRSYVLSPYTDFRTKTAREWRDTQAARGVTVLTENQFRSAEAMQRSVRSSSHAMRYLLAGEPEKTLTWTDPRTGIGCKGRVDFLGPAGLVDLKTTRHPSPAAFGRDAARLHYPTRMAWYRDGATRATGRTPAAVVVVAVQNVAPWDVATYRLKDETLEAGRAHYERLMDLLRLCLDSGEWPGAAAGQELTLELPAWAGPVQEEDALITIGGEPMRF